MESVNSLILYQQESISHHPGEEMIKIINDQQILFIAMVIFGLCMANVVYGYSTPMQAKHLV